MEKLLMFTRSMLNCIDEWTEYTLRHERWLWVWKNLMKVLRKHFVRVSYARTAQMVDIGILVIGILSTLAFLPVAFRVVAYCTLAFCQWVYCLWHYVYWHYSQWRFVLWRFICGVLSRDPWSCRNFLPLSSFVLKTNRKLIKSISKLETEPNWTSWDKNQRCIKSKNLGFDPALIHALFLNRPGSYPNLGKFQWLGSF